MLCIIHLYWFLCSLVIVGGDGLYHEAVNGVMKRLANDRDLNVNDPNTPLPDIDLPMGLIPCGKSVI